jgi:hypothetical protein
VCAASTRFTSYSKIIVAVHGPDLLLMSKKSCIILSSKNILCVKEMDNDTGKAKRMVDLCKNDFQNAAGGRSDGFGISTASFFSVLSAEPFPNPPSQ